jgi:hypothetical protein
MPAVTGTPGYCSKTYDVVTVLLPFEILKKKKLRKISKNTIFWCDLRLLMRRN